MDENGFKSKLWDKALDLDLFLGSDPIELAIRVVSSGDDLLLAQNHPGKCTIAVIHASVLVYCQ